MSGIVKSQLVIGSNDVELPVDVIFKSAVLQGLDVVEQELHLLFWGDYQCGLPSTRYSDAQPYSLGVGLEGLPLGVPLLQNRLRLLLFLLLHLLDILLLILLPLQLQIDLLEVRLLLLPELPLLLYLESPFKGHDLTAVYPLQLVGELLEVLTLPYLVLNVLAL